jgi:hypothetical protein
MAKTAESKQPKGWVAATAGAMAKIFGRGGGVDLSRDVEDAGWTADMEILSSDALSGDGGSPARSRRDIYAKWSQMLRDPIVSSAIKLHCTAALGGHETSGDVVFMEDAAHATDDDKALVEKVRADLLQMLNRVAPTVAYRVAGFGDAYTRLYQREGEGVLGIEADEMLLPGLVQPYERAGKTCLITVAVGKREVVRLTMDRIARFKGPRLGYIPQTMAEEKAWRLHITTDDPDSADVLPMPSLVGGSFLADVEAQYDKFAASLAGMTGQRLLDSIDESFVLAQVQFLTKEQRTRFLGSLQRVLKRSKDVAMESIASGKPFLQRLRHIIPVFSEKQLVSMQGVNSAGGGGGGRAGTVGIDDVLMNAKLLAGALGTDLTQLGFADQLSASMGDGGAFRTSAQTAERSRSLRIALADGFNHIIVTHCMLKYGRQYLPGREPWVVNFYGTISALESERQRTIADAMNASALMVQTLTQARDLGLDKPALEHLLSKVMKIDEDAAKLYTSALLKAAKDAAAAMEAQGGGFGGDGGGGGEPPAMVPGGTGDGIAQEEEAPA